MTWKTLKTNEEGAPDGAFLNGNRQGIGKQEDWKLIIRQGIKNFM